VSRRGDISTDGRRISESTSPRSAPRFVDVCYLHVDTRNKHQFGSEPITGPICVLVSWVRGIRCVEGTCEEGCLLPLRAVRR